MPGSRQVVGQHEHIAHGDLVVLPLPPVAPVFLVYLVLLVGEVLSLSKTAELFVFANMQPEFDYDDSMLRKLLLEVVNFLIRTSPFVISRKAFQAFD